LAAYWAEPACAKSAPSVATSNCRAITSKWLSTSSPSSASAARKSVGSKQANAVDFADQITDKFTIRIREIRTDNGHEFHAKFHWYVEDQGIRHAYVNRGTPQMIGKVERRHRSDQQKFYQLL